MVQFQTFVLFVSFFVFVVFKNPKHNGKNPKFTEKLAVNFKYDLPQMLTAYLEKTANSRKWNRPPLLGIIIALFLSSLESLNDSKFNFW